MSILVVGSVALDSVKTPFGEVHEALGGSAVYFSLGASYFADVNLVAVVGEDFPGEHVELLKSKGVDTEGLQIKKGNTFRWKGEYGYDLNNRTTHYTHLNVFENFKPCLPERYKKCKFVFLGNIDPVLQERVLSQVEKPVLTACDSMDFWIKNKKKALLKVLKKVDVFIINDSEARELSEEANLVKAAKKIYLLGPKLIIIKRGEYGALMYCNHSFFWAPAYLLDSVCDPTGSGDTFAGGFFGYLASCKTLNEANFKKAVIYASVLASFNVEDFSVNRLKNLSMQKIKIRYKEFVKLTKF
ncbi:MAG: PfkB family carbohydrate kinase [Candidatus Omnitrophota bacterium]